MQFFFLFFVVLCCIAPAHAADVKEGLAADAVCTRCHDQSENKPILAMYQTPHGVKADGRAPSCQSCHGTSRAHVENKAGSDVRPPVDIAFGKKSVTSTEQVQACVGCHKNGQRNHWEGSKHEAANVACSSCHTVHAKQDKVVARDTQPQVCFSCHQSERSQLHRISAHPVMAGKMTCSDCHNPHGSTGPSLLKAGSVNETCVSCHGEKRGPFLWEHAPVTDSCTNCHTPHGSNITPLLKVRTPWLCQSCHSANHAAGINSGANLQNGGATTVNGTQPLANSAARFTMAGRNCQSCHMQTHGSNHPAGAKLIR